MEFFDFKIHGDSRGQLVAIEQLRDVPFEIKRVYYMYDTTQGVRRGFHAHKSLQQVLICVNGQCTILLDDGNKKSLVTLNNSTQGLFVDKLIWHEMYDFSDGAILMSLASDYDDESDYIRDYNEFLAYMKER